MLPTLFLAWLAVSLDFATLYGWVRRARRQHTRRPHQPSNVIDFADAKARRKQAQRVRGVDFNSIHGGAS